MSKEKKTVFCSIDIEATGRNHRIHDMIQLCILPLNKRFEPYVFEAFYIQLKASAEAVIDPKALEINGLDPTIGLDRDKALVQFNKWVKWFLDNNEADLITPIGQNYSYDEEFMKNWMGFDEYYKVFDYNVRDTKRNAALFSDSTIPGFKSGLADQAKYFGIENKNHHDAMNDCIVAAGSYRAHVEYMNKLKG